MNMVKKDKKLMRDRSVRLIKSFKHAFDGIRHAFKYETNFFIHTVVALLVIIMGELLNISSTEWILVILCISLVLSFELINTAVEKLCDLVSKEYNEYIKITKDCAAASVLVFAVMSIAIGLIIFLPKIISLF